MRLKDQKLLICVFSCRSHTSRQEAVLETWYSDIRGRCDFRIVEGGHQEDRLNDPYTLELACADDYASLSEKTFAMLEFVDAHCDFDYLLKVDDDSYLHIERLLAFDPQSAKYIGNNIHGGKRKLFFTAQGPIAFAQGSVYLLSRAAVRAAVRYKRSNPESFCVSTAEDRVLGLILHNAGIRLQESTRFNPGQLPTPYQDPALISSHWARDRRLHRIHRSRSRPYLLNRTAYYLELLRGLLISCLSWFRRTFFPGLSPQKVRRLLGL